jgi:hypothetical protein
MILRSIWSIGLTFVILATGLHAQPAPSPSAAPTARLLQPAELDQLVAPIALYPDPLLAEVLMASTYPLDVVQAERWLQSNKNIKDDALKAVADKQNWDQSVRSLLATPDVLEMMSSKLDWTQKLGDAVVAQQTDVMDAIQRLRTKAQANNKLPSTKQQTVTVTKTDSGQVIAIEPTDPNTVYVPYYDPGVVYGNWSYPDYPPYYWPAPGYIGAGIVATGIAFGTGYALGRWASGRYFWGGNVNWSNRNININRPVNGVGINWKPNVEHRQGGGGRGSRPQGLTGPGNGGKQVVNPGGNRGNKGGNGSNAGGNRSKAETGKPLSKAKTRSSSGSKGHHAATKQDRGNAHHARPSGGTGAGRAAAGTRAHGAAARAHGGGGRGGRRSDIRLKHNIVLLGYLDDGLGFYRFSYNGSHKAYVGVIAQEVLQVIPDAVARGRDGYLTVNYDKVGVAFESYSRWLRSGARVPSQAGQ